MTAALYNFRSNAWNRPAARSRAFGTGWIGPMGTDRRRRGEAEIRRNLLAQAACEAGAIQEIDARAAGIERPDRVSQRNDMSRKKILNAPRSDRPLAALDRIRTDRTRNPGSIGPVNPVTITRAEQIHEIDRIAVGDSNQPRSGLDPEQPGGAGNRVARRDSP